LIQKIYEVEPPVCPKRQGAMPVIASIENTSVIRVVLEHLGLWLARARPPPKIHDPPVCMHGTGRPTAPSSADDVSPLPAHDDHFYGGPHYLSNYALTGKNIPSYTPNY